MMKKIFYLLSIVFLMSCQEKQNLSAYYLEGNIDVSLKDKAGNDLLDQNLETAYDINHVKILYQVNNEVGPANKYLNAGADYPNAFFLFDYKGINRMRIFINLSETNDSTTTYIQWNENNIDTVNILFDRKTGSILQKKIWYNHKLIYDRDVNNTERYFIIEK